jgi:hypothetical protein
MFSSLTLLRNVDYASYFIQILALNPTVRDACISGNLATAEELLTQEIKTNGNNYNSYANRSFLMARKLNWDGAIHDALKVRHTAPS